VTTESDVGGAATYITVAIYRHKMRHSTIQHHLRACLLLLSLGLGVARDMDKKEGPSS
jgi:hypothetical protein